MTSMFDTPKTSTPASDADVVALSLVEPGAFGELFERHVDAIHRFVAARVGVSAAEDIVSEAFAIAFDRRERFDLAATSARPWLYGIAARRLLKHRDQERAWLRRAAAMQLDAAADPFDASGSRMDAAQLAPQLAAALLVLSPGERDVVLLNVLDDLGSDEIATALGIRVGTARSRLSRGLAKLRTALEDDNG